MEVHYNKRLKHCIEIYDSSKSVSISISDAKNLLQKLSKAIEEAESANS